MPLILVGLFEKTDYDSKISENKGEIPSIMCLATTATLNDVKNKIANVSDLVKERDYDAKINNLRENISPHLIKIDLQMKQMLKRS